jgi:hypothetical protein
MDLNPTYAVDAPPTVLQDLLLCLIGLALLAATLAVSRSARSVLRFVGGALAALTGLWYLVGLLSLLYPHNHHHIWFSKAPYRASLAVDTGLALGWIAASLLIVRFARARSTTPSTLSTGQRLRSAQSMRTLRASLTYFALVFGTGFLLGAVRVPLLVPRLGERTAELLEMPVMLAVIVLAARFVVRRFALRGAQGAALVAGFAAVILLLGAEVLLTLTLTDRSLVEYVAGRDPVSGSVYLGCLVLMTLLPWLLARSRGASPRTF